MTMMTVYTVPPNSYHQTNKMVTALSIRTVSTHPHGFEKRSNQTPQVKTFLNIPDFFNARQWEISIDCVNMDVVSVTLPIGF